MKQLCTRITFRPACLAAGTIMGLSLLVTNPAGAKDKGKASDGNEGKVEAVLILSRHGVRSPLRDNKTLDSQTSNTWPVWNVQPGYLTPRGRKLVVSMGGYYRDQFLRDGLLTGHDNEDKKHAYFHTNTIQRTIQTGCALAEGIFPSTTTTVHYLVGKRDLLYNGGHIDSKIQKAAINGRIGDNEAALADAMAPQIDLVEKSLNFPGLFTRKMSSIGLAASMADSYMLEYCQGLPMSDVAFGRATVDELKEMYKILALNFDLKVRTPYMAQVRMSNMVSHIEATLEQAASGKPVKGAFGDADDRLFVIVGHDTTISSVAGLLDLDWVLPDTGRNLCPPGGALVFELRSHLNKKGEKAHYVRVYYAAETLKQMREFAKLSLDNPPALAPIFVPGASTRKNGYECPLDAFAKVVKNAVDPKLVYPIDDGDAAAK